VNFATLPELLRRPAPSGEVSSHHAATERHVGSQGISGSACGTLEMTRLTPSDIGCETSVQRSTPPPLLFLAIPLFSIVEFAILFGAAIALR
jgi:hypothetical protein